MASAKEGIGSRGRALGLALLLVLVAAVAAAVAGRRMPEALDAAAPDELFSAGRARRLLDTVARARHPVGSEEHECVREFLVQELGRIGLVEEQRGRVDRQPLTNLLAHIPGCASTGTVLCLAHYDTKQHDSKPSGPGAGDDGVGVVAWLEALRALRGRGWRPANDVLLLLSDGEELGLLGAQLFALGDPRVESVETVINLEAIGNGGPALLFQLGPGNAARVREFAACVDAPAGSSLGEGVFRLMPNDTDLSVFLQRGIAGFNLALTSGSTAYHAPHDTPANLDPRSLQHMGECALALLERLGDVDLAASPAPDVTFFDLFGRGLVRWPRAWDAPFALLGLGLALHAWRRSRASLAELFGALVAHALAALRLGDGLTLAWGLVDRLVALVTPDLGWVAGNTTSGSLLFAGLVLTVSGLAVRRSAWPDLSGEAPALAAQVAWSVGALLALVLAPGSAFVLYGPSILAALARAAGRGERTRVLAGIAQVLCFAAALLLTLPILHVLVQLAQRLPAAAIFAFALVLASGVELLAEPLRAIARAGRGAGLTLLALGAGALCLSVFVARVLAWRSGALWP